MITYKERKELFVKSGAFPSNQAFTYMLNPTKGARLAKQLFFAEKRRREEVKLRTTMKSFFISAIENLYHSYYTFEEIRDIRKKIEEELLVNFLEVPFEDYLNIISRRSSAFKKEPAYHFEHCLLAETLEKFGLPSEEEFFYAYREHKDLKWDSKTNLEEIKKFMKEKVEGYYNGTFNYPEDKDVSFKPEPLPEEEGVETIGV